MSVNLAGSGIDLRSGDTFQVELMYDGTTLTETITDTQTGAQFTTSYLVNITGIVGTNTAFVGFTGGTGGTTAIQDIVNWHYSTTSGTGGPGGPAVLALASGGPSQDEEGAGSSIPGSPAASTNAGLRANGLAAVASAPAEPVFIAPASSPSVFTKTKKDKILCGLDETAAALMA
jgi:hypothetical protein